MRTQHIIIAWIGTLIFGSLLIYPAHSAIEAITGIETFANSTDYWRMTLSYGGVALVLSLPNLFILLSIRGYLREWLRFENQFDAALIISLIGIWVGAMLLNKELDAALAYSVSNILTILALRFAPQERRSTLVI